MVRHSKQSPRDQRRRRGRTAHLKHGRRRHEHGIIADNFAGGGGASLGFELALGKSPYVAVNHDAEAIAMHTANHPATKHLIKSVYEVDPVEACDGKPVDIAWFSPDCFPAGTLVLTRRGYEPIESLQVGDEVLTHRGRWRRVTETSRSMRPLMRLRGHGHPGLLVSPEHPFYARDGKHGDVGWVNASAIVAGHHYWSTPVSFPDAAVPPVPASSRGDRGGGWGRSMSITDSLMWLAGRYVADGWARLTDDRSELVITCGMHEVEELRSRFASWWGRSGARAGTDELSWTEREVPSTETSGSYQFSTTHRGLVMWLREQFGHGSEHKSFPSWALGMPAKLRQALLDGYVSGDGWKGHPSFVEVTTVSKALAFSAKALASSLGFTVAVYRGQNSSVIEGRAVNALPYYRLRWRTALNSSHKQTVRDGHLEFAPIREVDYPDDLIGCERVDVFNIGVEEDESYVVEGIVVHNCKHFSKAKGGKPRDQRVRGLAWITITWAQRVQPRVILLENVEEFRDWGPLHRTHSQACAGACLKGCHFNRPVASRKGETFRAFVRKLERLGYVVEHRLLRACDYGAPTTRKRLFLIARRDGEPIVWPSPTHGPGRAPYRTAADCIDWTIPCPSIFDRSKPLADKTLARIARGIKKFVLGAGRPFLIPVNHGGVGRKDHRVHSIDDPVPTVTGGCRGGHAVVAPVITRTGQTGGRGDYVNRVTDPLTTVVTKAEHLLIAPYLVHRSNGERPGQAPRIYDPLKPIGTIVAQGQKHALCPAFLARHFGGRGTAGSPLDEPTRTVTTQDHHGLVAAHLIKFQGTSERLLNASGHSMEDPVPTITAQGNKLAQVAAFLVRYNGTGDAEPTDAPLGTVTTKPRFGLATVTIDGDEYAIVDIGMRMLTPKELARAQGFVDGYKLSPIGPNGKPLSQTAQIRMIGNSVSPPVAAALIRANA